MKYIWIVVFILLAFFLLSLTKFQIKKQITINASKEEVWKAIIDFKNYDKWNTQLTFLGGEVKPEGYLRLKLSVTGTKPYTFEPKISHWEEERRFAWLARTGIPRIFDGEHFFELQELEEDKTLVTNREEYRGVISLLMKNLPMMKSAPQGFEQMNKELKAYVESKE